MKPAHRDTADSVPCAVQRQVSPRTTKTKALEYIGAVAGKYQWDDRPGGDADKDVQGEAITKYCWSELEEYG